ncbi:MAG: NAD-dependent epimerase/dehydratase family protein [Pseudoxanthomonas sp.]
MNKVLLAGASGMVGSAVLRQALADPRIGEVVAPARRALATHAKLRNPLVDFDDLPVDAPWWEVDAVICTLGTTIRDAGSRAAFRKVDFDYPLAVARNALEHGASTFVLTSATGASADSRIFYSRTKGELENALRALGYESLCLVRPGLLEGARERHRPLEHAGMKLLGAMGPLLPRRYRAVPAEQVAATLLRMALQAGPGLHIVESEAIGAG